MADEDAPHCKSSSSSSTSPPRKKRREDERPRRLHHCIWSCPSASSANGPSASNANGGGDDGDANCMKKPADPKLKSFGDLQVGFGKSGIRMAVLIFIAPSSWTSRASAAHC